jgi:hypothetical protein
MKKLVQVLGLIAGICMVGAAPGFAQNQNGQGQNGQGQNQQGGGGTPAPEIGASVLGMLLASAVAVYLYRRRRG